MQVYATYRFSFDKIFGPDSQQEQVYEHSAREAVIAALQVYLVLNLFDDVLSKIPSYSKLVMRKTQSI